MNKQEKEMVDHICGQCSGEQQCIVRKHEDRVICLRFQGFLLLKIYINK